MNRDPRIDSSLMFRIVDTGLDDDGMRRLELSGNLDADGAPILAEALDARLAQGDQNLRLDLDHVPFISSSGIGSLIAAIGEFRDGGGDVLLRNLSPGVREVFDALELLDYVTIESTS